MMIEQNTNYAYKLKYMDNPTFDKVRDLAVKFYRELPQELQDDLYDALNRGVDILDSEPQMTAYMFSFGKMHQAKLNYAFGKLPEQFFEQPDINIIDYGCGQALGTMCYADYLREDGYAQQVKNITLIEPSVMCLKRAALHASVFFPDAEIKTVKKEFNDLTEDDIVCRHNTITLHVFSNVLDMLCFDLEKFAGLIKGCLKGYNQFVCVGPFFNDVIRDGRIKKFASLFGDESYYEALDKKELNINKDWTCALSLFKDYYFYVDDGFGVSYSEDGTKLLRCDFMDRAEYLSGNAPQKKYSIKEGTKVIFDRAFDGSNLGLVSEDSWIEEIQLPESITTIGCGSFDYCFPLKKINLPNSLVFIGDFAFRSCEKLESITIPKSVKFVGANPFSECKKILISSESKAFVANNGFFIDVANHRLITYFGQAALASIPSTIQFIGDEAFGRSKQLERITLPNTITHIGNSAFADCESLQYINLPSSIVSIGEWAFSGCRSLDSITIPHSLTVIESDTFGGCASLKRINLPSTITSIGERAFSGCKSLKHFTIPESLHTIGGRAFSGCESLKHLTIPESLQTIADNPFTGCSNLTLKSKSKRFVVSNNMLIDKSNNQLIAYCGRDESITITAQVASIGSRAFTDCKTVKQIIISDGVTSIAERAFYDCKSLQQIVISDSVTTIENGAFSNCRSLKRVCLPESLTRIEDSTFWDCESLEQIVIPSSVTSIGESAFEGCKSLKQLIIPDSVTSIGACAFKGCESIKQVAIPDSVTSIASCAFCLSPLHQSAVTLHSIIIPKTVVSIGEGAFSGCSVSQAIVDKNRYFMKDNMLIEVDSKKLLAYFGKDSQIIIPKSVVRIGGCAFKGHECIEQVAIHNSILSISDRAFRDCKSLQRIIIPKGYVDKFKKMLYKDLWDKLVEE